MRVLLCDEHRLVAEPVAAVLEMRGHEVLVTTCPAQAGDALDEFDADVCLTEVRFPGVDGVEAVRALCREHPTSPVVVLSGSMDPRLPSAVVAAGAVGFVRKDQPITALHEALDRVAGGLPVGVSLPKTVCSAASGEHSRIRNALGQLTDRERGVLSRLMAAEDTEAIARALGVATSTVRTHLQNVLLKLGVHSRREAVAVVTAVGLDER